jgi:hypothetical protein
VVSVGDEERQVLEALGQILDLERIGHEPQAVNYAFVILQLDAGRLLAGDFLDQSADSFAGSE